MDECIRAGVLSREPTLPGRLRLRRRAPMLYSRLMRGFYAGMSPPQSMHHITAGDQTTADAQAGNIVEYMKDRVPEAFGAPPSRSTIGRRSLTKVVGKFDHILTPCPPVHPIVCGEDLKMLTGVAAQIGHERGCY